MPYIDTKYLGKCETCRHCVGEIKCNTYCDHGEEYYPSLRKIPTADVAPRSEVAREIFEEIEFDIHQLMFERDEHRAIAIEGVIANLKKKYTEDLK